MRRRTVAAAVLVAALLMGELAGAVPVSAAAPKTPQRQAEIGKQISSLRAQVGEASAEEAALLDQLDEASGRIEALSDKVRALDADILRVQGEVDAAQARLDELEGQYRRARSELDGVRARLAAARQQLRARAVVAYVEGPALATYAVRLLEEPDDRAAAAKSGYLDSVVRSQRSVVERFRSLQREVRRRAESLETSRELALDQRAAVAARRAELQAARDAQDALRQQALRETNRRAQLLEQVRSRKAEFQQQIAALQAESDAIGAFLRSRQSGQGTRPSGAGVLAVPVPGARITSRFGPRVHPIFGDTRVHAGIDFGAATGTPIYAAADGEVVFAGVRGGYGNATIIDHGRSLATLYAHQSVILVRVGQVVRRGQLIGRVGSTGNSTGPHLHFEVRVAGTPVDPMRYL